MNIKHLLIGIASLLLVTQANAQQQLTKEQIMNMSIEQLSDLPLEDLMQAVEILGVSSVDELFALVMNKNVSAASKKEESAFTSPLSTTVITRQEMRTWGVSTIEEAFRLIPGIVAEEKTNGIYNLYIRGLNNVPDGQRLVYTENNNVLLMIDGRNITDYMAGGLYTEALPVSIEDVERIEVVRGASSALYGQNAVQGAINIITAKPNTDAATIEGSIQLGNQNTVVGDVAFRKAISNKFAMGITANVQRRDRNTDQIYLSNYGNLWKIDDLEAFNAAATTEEKKQFATELTEGQWISRDDLALVRDFSATQNGFYSIVQKQTSLEELIPEPQKARETYGVNGYLSFTPNPDVTIHITGGYQNASSINSTAEEYKWSHGRRIRKSAYGNIEGNIHNLHFNAGYTQGPGTYACGIPGFKINTKQVNASVDYDINLGNLSIRPGFAFLHTAAEDYTPGEFMKADKSKGIEHDGNYIFKNNEYLEVKGFFCNSAAFNVYSPSLRLDYKTNNNWRFIGAYRLDKTDNPDRFNHSWQFAVNKEIGDKNFIRLSYGRATRSAVLLNSDANYKYSMDGKSLPKYVYLEGENPKLLHIDGIEFGWRSRPVENLLIDAELFYNYSTDYGSLQSTKSYLSTSPEKMGGFLGTIAGAFAADYATGAQETGNWATVAQTLSNTPHILGEVFDGNTVIAFGNLPYQAHQFGLSVNVDWIISPKLIAKFNINFQNTKINNYYRYSHKTAVGKQINACMTDPNKGLVTISKDYGSKVLNYAGTRSAVAQAMGQTPNMNAYITEYIVAMAGAESGMIEKYGAIAAANPEFVDRLNDVLIKDVVMKGMNPNANVDVQIELDNGEKVTVNSKNLIATYYAVKYNVHIDNNTGDFIIANGDAEKDELEDAHKHKATPDIYGMAGLIYKPIKPLTVSAFVNYIGKRDYQLSIGDSHLPNRLTMNLKVGYKPADCCEIFFNAHNLFNTKKQEFAHFDKIGGLYTFGVNFNL